MTAVADRSPAREIPARSLWWIYLIGALALIATGAGAGQLALQLGHPSSSLTVVQCWLNHGLDPATVRQGLDSPSTDPVVFGPCTRENSRRVALVSLAGAAAVPAAAWLLMLADSLTTRRRLTRNGAVRYSSDTLAAAGARFDHWCDEAGLVGRRRPQLLLGGAGRLTAQAHTTAVPFARPVVVIPAAYAYTEAEQLDLAVLHELAHVRSRDLTWASAVWWSGWLNLPVLLLAVAPLLFQPTNVKAGYYLAPLGLALVQSAVILLLRAAVLRRREQTADRYAVTVLGDSSALAAAVRPPAVEPGFRATVRGWIAVHPPAATRVRDAARADDGWETGFTLALIAGLVTMFTGQALYLVLTMVSNSSWEPRLPLDLALIGTALLWAVIQVPVWARSAGPVLGSAPGRTAWTAIAGSALGLTAGFFLRSPGTIEVLGRTAYAGHLGLAVGCFLTVALGVSVLAAGLASAVRSGPARLRTPAAVIGAATLVATGFSVCLADVAAGVRFNAAGLRALLLHQGDSRWTGWTPLVLLAVAGILAGGGPAGDGPSARAAAGRLIRSGMLVAALTGAVLTAALATLRLRENLTEDGVYLLLVQRLWVCGLCGAVAAAVILLVVRTTIVPALLAGAVVAEFVGLAQFARDAVAGSGRNLHNLALFARLPLWLLFVVLVVALPVLLLIRDAAFLLGRRAVALRPAGMALVTLAATTTVALTVMSGAAGAVTVAHGDAERAQQPVPTASLLPAVPSPPPAPTAPAGPAAERSLTKKQAAAVLAEVKHRLPDGWTPAANNTTPTEGVQPASCDSLFASDRAIDRARPKSAQVIRTFTLPKEKLGPSGATLIVTLTSYRTARIARQAIEDSPGEARRCPRWSVPLESGELNHYSWGPNRALDLPFPNRPQWLESKVTTAGYSFVTQNAFGQLVAGRNLASVSVIHSYLGSTMPKDRVDWMRGLRQKVLADLVTALG